MKSKVSELEDYVREGFYRRVRKKFTGMVQLVYGERRFLVSFQ